MSDLTKLSDAELIEHILHKNSQKSKQCSTDGCRHYAGYEDWAGVEYCGCCFLENTKDACEGQPEPGPKYLERVTKDLLEWFERIDS